jgi:hypothetical protein
VNVRTESLEWRDVDDADLVGQSPFQTLLEQVVEHSEERRQRLARSGGCSDERVPARSNGLPAQPLPRSR